MSTIFYNEQRRAMYIDSVQRMDRVTASRIVNKAASWGIARHRAAEIVDEILLRVPVAIEAAAEQHLTCRANSPPP